MKKRVSATPYSKIRLSGKKVLIRPYKFTDFARCQSAHESRLPKVNEFDDETPISKEANLNTK